MASKVFDKKIGVAGYFYPAITVCLWSSAFVGIRATLSSYAPGHLALLRFLIASAALVVLATITRMRFPRLKDIPLLFLLGAVGIAVYQVALGYGERTVTSGSASFIVATVPVITALMAQFALREKLLSLQWIGIAISFFGVALISVSMEGAVRFEPGAVLVLVAAVAEAIYFVAQKPLLSRYSGLELATYTIWTATVTLLIFTPGFVDSVMRAKPSATWSVIYLGLAPGSIAYITWAKALARSTASRATTSLYLMPIITLALAWPWLGEVPTALSLVGGALSIVGVVTVHIGKNKVHQNSTDKHISIERLSHSG